jgi:hypothetical protein
VRALRDPAKLGGRRKGAGAPKGSKNAANKPNIDTWDDGLKALAARIALEEATGMNRGRASSSWKLPTKY